MVYFFRGQAPKTNLETQVDPVVMSEERKQQEIAIPVNQPPAAIPILPEEKSLYFNGFGIAVGGGDIIFTLMRNGVPTLTLNASFTVAKTFGESMVECIRQFEAATNHKIMTVQEVVNFQAKANAPSESS